MSTWPGFKVYAALLFAMFICAFFMGLMIGRSKPAQSDFSGNEIVCDGAATGPALNLKTDSKGKILACGCPTDEAALMKLLPTTIEEVDSFIDRHQDTIFIRAISLIRQGQLNAESDSVRLRGRLAEWDRLHQGGGLVVFRPGEKP